MNKRLMVFVLIMTSFIALVVLFDFIFRNDGNLRKAAEFKVELFQKNYNKNELDILYENACVDFKKATSESEFLSIMNGKKEVFGVYKSSTLLHSNVINSQIIELSYRSVYSHYSLIEKYTYNKINDSELCLKGFYIDDSGRYGEVIKL